MVIKIGSKNITAIKYGSKNVSRVYYGSKQIFPSKAVPPPITQITVKTKLITEDGETSSTELVKIGTDGYAYWSNTVNQVVYEFRYKDDTVEGSTFQVKVNDNWQTVSPSSPYTCENGDVISRIEATTSSIEYSINITGRKEKELVPMPNPQQCYIDGSEDNLFKFKKQSYIMESGDNYQSLYPLFANSKSETKFIPDPEAYAILPFNWETQYIRLFPEDDDVYDSRYDKIYPNISYAVGYYNETDGSFMPYFLDANWTTMSYRYMLGFDYDQESWSTSSFNGLAGLKGSQNRTAYLSYSPWSDYGIKTVGSIADGKLTVTRYTINPPSGNVTTYRNSKVMLSEEVAKKCNCILFTSYDTNTEFNTTLTGVFNKDTDEQVGFIRELPPPIEYEFPTNWFRLGTRQPFAPLDTPELLSLQADTDEYKSVVCKCADTSWDYCLITAYKKELKVIFEMHYSETSIDTIELTEVGSKNGVVNSKYEYILGRDSSGKYLIQFRYLIPR